MNTTTLDTISAALASASPVTYKLSTRTHPRTDDEIVVLDSAGSDVAEDGSDDASVRDAMSSLGYEFVDSGANGAPGGYYSYWRAVSTSERFDGAQTPEALAGRRRHNANAALDAHSDCQFVPSRDACVAALAAGESVYVAEDARVVFTGEPDELPAGSIRPLTPVGSGR